MLLKVDLNKVMNEQITILNYFIHRLYSKKCDIDYFDVLRLDIIPIIRLMLPDLVKELEGELKNYQLRAASLEKNVVPEVKQVWKDLKKRLADEKIANDPVIAERSKSLESILNFQPEDGKIFVMPAQHEIAVERLKELCDAIASLGRKDVVNHYVETFTNIYRQNSKSRFFSCIEPAILYFDAGTFVPSYIQLRDQKRIFEESVTNAWSFINAFEWGYPTKRRDLFRKKSLSNKNPKEAARSALLLNAHSFWLEVKALKEKKKEQSLLLNRTRFNDALSLVLNKISPELVSQVRTLNPKAVMLAIEQDNHLCLIIEWMEGVYQACLLHIFHDDPNNVTGLPLIDESSL